MSVQHITFLLARARLVIYRFGAIKSATSLLCVIGGAVWIWGIPQLHAQLEAKQKAATTAYAAFTTASQISVVEHRTVSEERLALFYDSLGDRRYQEQQVKSLFSIAAKNNLILSQAEYKPAFDKRGRYYTYQITVPVKGTYEAIRQFSEQTLLSIPFASLNEVSFKRESVGAPTLEAKLRFTLYLRDDVGLSPVASPRQEDSDA